MPRARTFAVALTLLTLVAACKTQVSEPESTKSSGTEGKPASTTTVTQAPTPPPPPAHASAGPDPLGGKFSLAEATKDLPGSGPLHADIETSMGKIDCKLLDEKAPITVANFIGLATGKRSWLDPATNTWVNKPAYDGTTFHRVIKGFMIQGGDPKGNGTGEPGYVIPDETWPGSTHDKAGLLCMANRGPNTNGAQFFITESDGPSVKNLDRLHSYTIFGECTQPASLATVHAIAAVKTMPGDRPVTPVTINSVKIRRGGA